MFLAVAAEQTSTVKIPVFFFIFQTEEHVPRVNKSDVIGEKAFNEHLFKIEENQESGKDEKTWI